MVNLTSMVRSLYDKVPRSIKKAARNASLLFALSAGTAFSQNQVSGHIESIPNHTKDITKVEFIDKTDTTKIYSARMNVSTGDFSIDIPSGNYIQRIRRKDHALFEDRNVSISGSTVQDIQMLEDFNLTTTYYPGKSGVYFTKVLSNTAYPQINTKLSRSPSNLNMWRRVHDDNDPLSMPAANEFLDYQAAFDYAINHFQSFLSGIVQMNMSANSVDTATTSEGAINYVYLPYSQMPGGGLGYREIIDVQGFVYTESRIYISTEYINCTAIAQAVNLREIERALGLQSFSSDPSHVMYDGYQTNNVVSPDEQQVLKRTMQIVPETDMYVFKEDSILTSHPIFFAPSTPTITTPNGAQFNINNISLQTSGSVDPDNAKLTYKFILTGTKDTTISSNNPSVTPSLPIGSYSLQVQVDDNTGNIVNSTPINFQVIDTPPTITTPLGSQNIPKNSPKTFSRKLSQHFSDLEGALSFTANSSNPNIQTQISADSLYLTLTPGTSGNANITVTATDANSASVQDILSATVNNRSPIVAQAITDKTFPDGSQNLTLAELSQVFSDPDNDALIYEVTGDPNLGLNILGTQLKANLNTGIVGTFDVIIKAKDNENAAASDTFKITTTEVDRTPPVGNISALVIDAINYVRFKIGANENLQSASLKVNSQNVALAKNNQNYFGNYTLAGNTQLNVEAIVNDLGGNVDTVSKSYNVAYLGKPTQIGNLTITPQDDHALSTTADSSETPTNLVPIESPIEILGGAKVKFRLPKDINKNKAGIYTSPDGKSWNLRRQYDGNDNIETTVNNEKVAVFYDPSAENPKSFNLYQNYPNPFNPATAITYELPQNSHVKLEVYNIMGQKVATLIDKNQEAGKHNVMFDGNVNGKSLASGVYIYRLQAGKYSKTMKMTLVK